MNDIHVLYGQFICHDIQHTGENPNDIFKIPIPAGDPYFDPYSVRYLLSPLLPFSLPIIFIITITTIIYISGMWVVGGCGVYMTYSMCMIKRTYIIYSSYSPPHHNHNDDGNDNDDGDNNDGGDDDNRRGISI